MYTKFIKKIIGKKRPSKGQDFVGFFFLQMFIQKNQKKTINVWLKSVPVFLWLCLYILSRD